MFFAIQCWLFKQFKRNNNRFKIGMVSLLVTGSKFSVLMRNRITLTRNLYPKLGSFEFITCSRRRLNQ